MSNPLNRLTHFDGLRGLAAFTVFASHFLVAFYPATYTGDPQHAHTAYNIESCLRNSPLNLLFNGQFSVCVFFAISGYVLSYHYFLREDKRSVAASLVKRYPRLMVLVWFSALLAFVLLRINAFDNAKVAVITRSAWLGGLFKEPVTFAHMLRNIGYEQFLVHNVPIPLNPVLWTIATEFKGSVLVFVLLLLLPSGKWRFLIYIALLVYFSQGHYALFVFGVLLADLYSRKRELAIPFWGWLPVIAAVLVFGSYKPETPSLLWSWIGQGIMFTNPLFIGAAALLFLACYHTGTRHALGKAPFQWLGRISYPLYICHVIVICLLVCPVFYGIFKATALYHLSALAAFAASLPLTFGISVYVFGPVDRWSIRWSGRIGQKVKGWLNARKTAAGTAPVSE